MGFVPFPLSCLEIAEASSRNKNRSMEVMIYLKTKFTLRKIISDSLWTFSAFAGIVALQQLEV
jgi:hypothetical protein